MAASLPMSETPLEYNLDALLAFHQAQNPGLLRRDGMVGMGWRHHGKLVACVIFENLNEHNAWAHVAAVPGRRWMNRTALQVPFSYAFKVAKVKRISGYVDASNTDSIKFVEHLGFTQEARLSGAAKDGGDVAIYVMWRRDCRYV